jgi:RimJ/RimL family protein N-acetyltransferase
VTGAVRAGGDGASDGDLVTLDTPRLILRQWQATDLDRYVEMFADPEVARYIFRGQPARREQVSEMSGSYLRQWRDLRLGPFAAIDKATGAWIGQIGLNHLAYWPGPEKVEVGWELHRRWGGAGWPPKAGARPCGSASRSAGCGGSSARQHATTTPPGTSWKSSG